jgi:hypothetical protein
MPNRITEGRPGDGQDLKGDEIHSDWPGTPDDALGTRPGTPDGGTGTLGTVGDGVKAQGIDTLSSQTQGSLVRPGLSSPPGPQGAATPEPPLGDPIEVPARQPKETFSAAQPTQQGWAQPTQNQDFGESTPVMSTAGETPVPDAQPTEPLPQAAKVEEVQNFPPKDATGQLDRRVAHEMAMLAGKQAAHRFGYNPEHTDFGGLRPSRNLVQPDASNLHKSVAERMAQVDPKNAEPDARFRSAERKLPGDGPTKPLADGAVVKP